MPASRRPRWAIGEICGSLVWVVVCGFAPLREIRSAATLNITRQKPLGFTWTTLFDCLSRVRAPPAIGQELREK
jgi:hypothetical protein